MRFLNNSLTTERTIVGGFGAAVLVLCVVAGVSVWLTLALLNGLSEVSDHNDVLQANGAFRNAIGQMSSAARLYALDESEKAFEEWDRQQQDARERLKGIRGLTGSPEQIKRLDRIGAILDGKISRTHRGLDSKTLQEIWNADSFTEVRETLLQIDHDEQALVEARNNEATTRARAALWTIGLATLLALVMVGGAVAVILRDLKARRRAAEELERARLAAEAANVAKSAFLANISHELRTPLTSIIGYADLLLRTGERNGSGETPERRDEYLQTLRRSGEHLLSLINDILDVSKIEAGRMEVEKVDCRLVEVLADVNTLMLPRAEAKGIDFSKEYATAIPDRIMTDPTRLRQILVNLVGNAIKFTGRGTVRVVVRFDAQTVGADLSDGWLDVSVEDTGLGISDEQQKLLFQPFAQADVSTTRRFGGSGLGLSISLRLAEMMGGKLSVESALGAGSRFRLRLPVLVVASVLLTPEEARNASAGIRRELDYRPRQLGMRVLLAEDGTESQEVIGLHLMHAGCRVTAAANGEEGVRLAQAAQTSGDPFDVVLMDMQMPVMDGYTATSKLRAEGYQGVIVALTAHAMKEDRERCINVGCDEYATKPVDIPALLNLIERLCGRAGGSRAASDRNGAAAFEASTERLRDTPALRNLTRKFCQGTTQIIAELQAIVERVERGGAEAQARALLDLAAAAHKLAGSAGAYAFDAIAREAKELERLARGAGGADRVAKIRPQVAKVETLCGAAREQWLMAEEVARE